MMHRCRGGNARREVVWADMGNGRLAWWGNLYIILGPVLPRSLAAGRDISTACVNKARDMVTWTAL